MPTSLRILAIGLITAMEMFQSCGHPTPKKDAANPTDSSVRNAKLARADSPDETGKNKHYDLTDFHVFAQRKVSHYEFTLMQYEKKVDSDASYYVHDILLLKDTITGKNDTLDLNIDGMQRPEYLKIKDLTRDLEFSSLVFELDWEGDSDNIYSKVYGYKGDTLTELFDVPSAGGLVDLKRKDKKTLSGHCWGSDELLYWGRDDYIITVSLPDYSVDVHPPDIMGSYMDTEATDTIHAFKRGVDAGKRYIVHPGTPIHIDTFFYRLHLVTFHLGDSVFLKADVDSLQFKLKTNTAG